MTQYVQQGQINATALIVADAYIQNIQPQAPVTGVPTNVAGFVGTAPWGPVNSPVRGGNMGQYALTFGAIQNRTFDMGTAVAAAILQGANAFVWVRVTDGTDVAATIVVQSTCITFTSKYTGTLGNTCQVTISAGTKASTTKATVAMPGQPTEIYDNIAGTANALWVNMAAAINNGIAGIRGASQLIVATAGAGTTAPTLTSYTLASGTDGVTTITSAVMTGTDGSSRTGMYALRQTNCSVACLVDLSDYTTYSTQAAFALSENLYMVATGPLGDTISTAVTNKATAGVDTFAVKLSTPAATVTTRARTPRSTGITTRG